MTRRILTAALCAWPALASADALTIEHKGVGCVVAGKFARFEAHFDPAMAVARARVHFKPEGWPHWYSVPMKQEGSRFLGVLPKPDKKLEKFDYYISVVDRSFTESRTPEHTPIVVSGPGGCQQDKVLALALKKAAQVIVSGPEGIANAPLVPVGFSSDGVAAGAAGGSGPAAAGGTAAAGAGGVAVAGGAAAGAAAGGGISTTLLVVGAVAVAGGAAAVAVKSAGGAGGSGGDGANLYKVTFSPDIDVSVCAGEPRSFCGAVLSVDANGNFNEVLSQLTPNTARIVGRVDATSFNATFSCFSGSPTTALLATGSGGTYRGSFSFNGSGGTLTVTKGSSPGC